MADTTFVNGTVVQPSWLNDVNDLTYTFNQGGTSTNRTAFSKLQDTISVKDFGAVGDGIVDDTTALQTAITFAQSVGKAVYFPTGKYKCTSTLNVTSGISLIGDSPKAKNAGGADFLGGSWLFFSHTGKGISIINSSGIFTDVVIESLGTYRTQPAPAVSWAPTAHDYDVYCFGVADVVIRSVLMLNPTKAIGFFGDVSNGPGRLEIYNFRAQAFQVGIMIDTAYDVIRLDHIHFWPFWRDNTNVHTYTLANLDAIYSQRSDNPMLSNIFTIFARSGLRIGQNARGGTSKLHLTNADFDRGLYGIWSDSSVTTGFTAQLDNVTTQGETGVVGSKGIFIQGNNSKVQIGTYSSAYSSQNGVRVEGTGNVLSFSQANIDLFDQSAVGFPAFEAADGNKISFALRPTVGTGGVGGSFSTTGTFVVDEWRVYTPTVAPTTGAFTTLGALNCKYKLVGNTVTVMYDIVITTVGTAGGGINVTLPLGSPVSYSSGSGREVNVTGKQHSTTLPTSGTAATILNYDNSFAGGSGYRLVGSFQYTISV